MKRPAWALSDAVIREMREVTVTGHIAGDFPNADGTHTLLIRVTPEAVVEIGGRA